MAGGVPQPATEAEGPAPGAEVDARGQGTDAGHAGEWPRPLPGQPRHRLPGQLPRGRRRIIGQEAHVDGQPRICGPGP